MVITKHTCNKCQSENIAPAQTDDQLELDEIFTFYTMKINHIRIWIALNKKKWTNRLILSWRWLNEFLQEVL